ncbi:MAG: hypothetical protein JW776_06575 [Candidatus Lokiarchaeota archaeon]|nr:hypothetical protein [Candidatus Lokiarchaeota archaeon]
MQQNRKNLQKYSTLISFSAVFWGFFIGAIFQGWDAISLLFIPLSHYLFFLWLQLEWILKTPMDHKTYYIHAFTLGNSEKISRRYLYCSIFELIIIITMGIESIYHPHLVERYFILYIIPFVIIFLFSPYFTMHDLGKNCMIILKGSKNELPITVNFKKQTIKVLHNTILIIDIALVVLWIGFVILGYFGIFYYPVFVPPSTQAIKLSYLLIILIIFTFVQQVAYLIFVHIFILNQTYLIVQNTPELKAIFSSLLDTYFILPRFFKA